MVKLTDPKRAKELDCQTAIISAAMLAGWLVHAERPAQTEDGWRTPVQGHAGYPDLTLCRRQELWFVELKRAPRSLGAAQHAWLAAFTRAARSGVALHVHALVVWVPEQQDDFIAELISARPDPTRFAYPLPGA